MTCQELPYHFSLIGQTLLKHPVQKNICEGTSAVPVDKKLHNSYTKNDPFGP